MDFELSDEEALLRDTIATFVARYVADGTARAAEESHAGYSVEAWRQMCELGLAGVLVPEQFGGTAGSLLELGIASRELGRGPVTSPLSGHAAAQIALLAAEQHADVVDLLRATTTGQATATFGHLEPEMFDEWSAVGTVAHPEGSSYRLEGAKILVPYLLDADVLVISARISDELALIRVPLADPDGVTRHHATGGDVLYQVDLSGVMVEGEAVLVRGSAAEATLEAMRDASILIELFYGVGLCERILEMTTEYARSREQFGRPIASFQAVSHRCVDMKVDLDACEVLVWKAADEARLSGARTPYLAIAKAYCNEALRRICINAHQVHGAIGFSSEYDLQLFTRRAKAIELSHGSSQFHLSRIADALVGG